LAQAFSPSKQCACCSRHSPPASGAMAPRRTPTLLPLLLLGAGAIELTPDTWDAETSGKSVFIKFLAPW